MSRLRRWLVATLGTAVMAGALALPSYGTDTVGHLAPGTELASDQLERLLRTDPTTHLDRQGRLFVTEPLMPLAATAQAQPQISGAALALDETFALHSLPGAGSAVFLDFDGFEVTPASAWASTRPGSVGAHPGWTPKRGGEPVGDPERRALIQQIWAQVAEDFAPFDIDVTTEEPSGTWRGSHAVITDSDTLPQAMCDATLCGGIAYIDAWGTSTATRPAFVFSARLGTRSQVIAEVISHEVGHNAGLLHDGQGEATYYTGHTPWAPIMGSGYLHPVTQWSRGEYAGATQAQDDLAVIAGKAPVRADEAAATVDDASVAAAGSGVITTREDVDTWRLGRCDGPVTITASPAPVGPNLDIELSVLDSTGQVVATVNPTVAAAAGPTATGLGATWSGTLHGDHAISIDGVGIADASTGYTDYGSLGTYTFASSGCSAEPLATTTTVTASVTGRDVTVIAAVDPHAQGAITFSRDGELLATRTLVGGGAQWTHVDAPLGPGAYTVTYVPSGPSWHSSSATTTVTVDPPPTLTPTPPPSVTPGVTPSVPPTPAPARITMTVRAPRTARVGERPRVRVVVRDPSTPSAARVRISAGRRHTTQSLSAGRARIRLRPLSHRDLARKRLVVRVQYLTEEGTVLARGRVVIRVRR